MTKFLRIFLSLIGSPILVLAILLASADLQARVLEQEIKVKGRTYTVVTTDENNNGQADIVGIRGHGYAEIRSDRDSDGIIDSIEIWDDDFRMKRFSPSPRGFELLITEQREARGMRWNLFRLNHQGTGYEHVENRFKRHRVHAMGFGFEGSLIESMKCDPMTGFGKSTLALEQTVNQALVDRYVKLLKESQVFDKSCKDASSSVASRNVFASSAEEMIEAIARVLASGSGSWGQYMQCLIKAGQGENAMKTRLAAEMLLESKVPRIFCKDQAAGDKRGLFSPATQSITFLQPPVTVWSREKKVQFYADTFFHEAQHLAGTGNEASIRIIDKACGSGGNGILRPHMAVPDEELEGRLTAFRNGMRGQPGLKELAEDLEKQLQPKPTDSPEVKAEKQQKLTQFGAELAGASDSAYKDLIVSKSCEDVNAPGRSEGCKRKVEELHRKFNHEVFGLLCPQYASVSVRCQTLKVRADAAVSSNMTACGSAGTGPACPTRLWEETTKAGNALQPSPTFGSSVVGSGKLVRSPELGDDQAGQAERVPTDLRSGAGGDSKSPVAKSPPTPSQKPPSLGGSTGSSGGNVWEPGIGSQSGESRPVAGRSGATGKSPLSSQPSGSWAPVDTRLDPATAGGSTGPSAKREKPPEPSGPVKTIPFDLNNERELENLRAQLRKNEIELGASKNLIAELGNKIGQAVLPTAQAASSAQEPPSGSAGARSPSLTRVGLNAPVFSARGGAGGDRATPGSKANAAKAAADKEKSEAAGKKGEKTDEAGVERDRKPGERDRSVAGERKTAGDDDEDEGPASAGAGAAARKTAGRASGKTAAPVFKSQREAVAYLRTQTPAELEQLIMDRAFESQLLVRRVQIVTPAGKKFGAPDPQIIFEYSERDKAYVPREAR